MKKQFSPDPATGGNKGGTGAFIPKLEADILIDNQPDRPNGFEIDTNLLTTYINGVNADTIRVVLAKTTTGSPTIVVYCMKNGVSVFHDQGGIDCVLEHVDPISVDTPI